MNLSATTLIAAARALDESRWYLGQAYNNRITLPQPELDIPELLVQTDRVLEEVEAHYNALRATQSTLPEFNEWIGYTE